MFFSFVDELRAAGISASMKEHLTLLEALDANVILARPEEFYFLARATFVKDEALLDRFDQVFGKVFKGLETSYGTETVPIPEDWLRKIAELYLTPEQMAEIKSLGSWEEIMETLKKGSRSNRGATRAAASGSARAAPPLTAMAATIRKGCASAAKAGTAERSRCGTKREFRNLDSSRSSARATSRSRSGASAASPAKARRTSSTSTRRSTAPRARAGSTSGCGPSGTMR
jgi:uncharacterized protein with von Willebrand factor type A (vWA) domain